MITKIPPAGLEDVGVTAGTKGSASEIPVVTVNAKGQVTSLGGVALDLSSKANVGGGNASGTWPISITGNSASANSVDWSGVSNRPTALSQFTNNLGNYGNFFDLIGAGDVGWGANCGGSANCGYGLGRTGRYIGFFQNNCNCNCNCF